MEAGTDLSGPCKTVLIHPKYKRREVDQNRFFFFYFSSQAYILHKNHAHSSACFLHVHSSTYTYAYFCCKLSANGVCWKRLFERLQRTIPPRGCMPHCSEAFCQVFPHVTIWHLAVNLLMAFFDVLQRHQQHSSWHRARLSFIGCLSW
jgi:hypothetical protein